jgi:hypothetical protein
MREFGKRSRLAILPLSARLVYSVFLVFTLVGLGVSAWLGETLVGADLTRLDEYYAGVAPAPSPAREEAVGPTLDLPEEVVLEPKAEPKSFRATLEVTHFHLFTMPIHWLVLAHLFALCAVAERWKAAFISASALAMGAHLVAPWVARSGGGLAKVFYGGSGGLLLLTFGWMAVSALAEMWRRNE